MFKSHRASRRQLERRIQEAKLRIKKSNQIPRVPLVRPYEFDDWPSPYSEAPEPIPIDTKKRRAVLANRSEVPVKVKKRIRHPPSPPPTESSVTSEDPTTPFQNLPSPFFGDSSSSGPPVEAKCTCTRKSLDLVVDFANYLNQLIQDESDVDIISRLELADRITRAAKAVIGAQYIENAELRRVIEEQDGVGMVRRENAMLKGMLKVKERELAEERRENERFWGKGMDLLRSEEGFDVPSSSPALSRTTSSVSTSTAPAAHRTRSTVSSLRINTSSSSITSPRMHDWRQPTRPVSSVKSTRSTARHMNIPLETDVSVAGGNRKAPSIPLDSTDPPNSWPSHQSHGITMEYTPEGRYLFRPEGITSQSSTPLRANMILSRGEEKVAKKETAMVAEQRCNLEASPMEAKLPVEASKSDRPPISVILRRIKEAKNTRTR